MPISPTLSTWAPLVEAFLRPKIPAAHGSRSPMKASPSALLARSRVAPSNANVVYVGTGRPDVRSQHSYGIGMFQSNKLGKTWKPIGLENTRVKSAALWWILRTRIAFTSPRSAMFTRPLRIAASIVPSMAVPRGRRFSRTPPAPMTSAPSTSPSTKRTLVRSTHRSGRPAVRHGPSTRHRTCQEAAFSNRPMEATLGSHSLAASRSISSSARSASPCRSAIRIVCGPWSIISAQEILPRAAAVVRSSRRGAASTYQTMRARTGSWSIPKTASGAEAGTSAASPSIPKILTAPTSSTPLPI